MAKNKIKLVTIEYSKSKNKENVNIVKLESELSLLKSKSRSQEINDQIIVLEEQINGFYATNRDAYILRSKVSHLIENETCSKYFFNLEKQRSKNKIWTHIKTESGQVRHGIDAILEEQVNYFSSLFKSEGVKSESANTLLSFLVSKVEDSDKEALDESISFNELNNAINTFKKGNSPGDDGLTSEWYNHFWYLIKK